MAFDVTGALVSGVILFMMLRRRSGVGWFVVAGALFGFFLAGTGVHGTVHSGLHSLAVGSVDWVRAHIH